MNYKKTESWTQITMPPFLFMLLLVAGGIFVGWLIWGGG